MPGLARSQWYDLTRDMNWTLSYVDQEEAWPQDLSNTYGIPAESWWGWDEPYKITYTEYVHNQVGKDAGVYSVNSVISRSRMFEELDPGWKSAIIARYGAIAIPEYLAGIGESRMAKDRPVRVRRQGEFLAADATVAESGLSPLDVLEVVYA
jgi:toluene monooxygenase system protein A